MGAESIPLSVHAVLQVGLTGYMPKNFAREDGRGMEVAQRYEELETNATSNPSP